MKEHTKKEYTVYEADEDAEYEGIVEIDLAEVRPTVAFPHLPEMRRQLMKSRQWNRSKSIRL